MNQSMNIVSQVESLEVVTRIQSLARVTPLLVIIAEL